MRRLIIEVMIWLRLLLTKTSDKWPVIIAVGAISAKLMLTSSATKHAESRVTSILMFSLCKILMYSFSLSIKGTGISELA